MKRRLFFITLLMLFCTTMFGQQHWTMSNSDIVDYPLNTTVTCSVTIEGQVPENITDLEIGAFHNNVLRGVAKPVSNGFGGYIVYLTVYSGSEGEIISFKLYNPATDKEYDTDYTIRFSNDIVGDFFNPVQIDFYSMHWSYNNNAENYMAYPCVIKIDGVIQNNPNLEIAAFINDELCGVAKPALEPNINIYMATLQIYGTNGQTINFKLFDPSIGENGAELETVYTETYNYDYNGGIVEIDFRNEAVAQIGSNYYATLQEALKAITSGCTLDILTDITIASDWDCRNTGATITVPVTINGNGKTIKFTGEISDGFNHLAAFRFEDHVTVNNLVVDMSEAVAVFQNRFSAISTKANLTVNESKFIGSTTYANSRAIIFGEGGHEGLEIVVNETEFINWKYGVVDNMNRGDVESVTVTGCTFDNADVLISAKETVTFTGNDMSSNSYVNISSYSVPNEVAVTAKENTNLAANTETEYNQIAAPLANINAQDGFLTPVAEAGGKYYVTLQGAVDGVADSGTITLLSDIELAAQDAQELFKPTYNRESYCGVYIPDDKTVVLELNGKTVSYLDTKYEVDNVMVMNLGNLTINDNSAEKTGKITYKPVAGSSQYAKFYSTIFNCGTLTVNAGTIENTAEAETDVTNAVDNHSRLSHEYGNNSILIVNGGTLSGAYYYAIRQYTHYFEGVQNRVVINDGNINGGIYMQHGDSWYYANPESNRLNVDCYLEIKGGNINVNTTSDAFGKIKSRLNNPDNNAFGLNISGGIINVPVELLVQRGVYYENGVSGTTVPAETPGTRNAEWLAKNDGFVQGGTFSQIGGEEEHTTNLELFLKKGYKLEQNTNGTYGVVEDPDYGMVAKIGETRYATLSDAFAAAQTEELTTIELLPVTISESTVILPATLKNVTVKGAEGAVLKDMTIMAADGNSINYEGITFDGVVFDNSRISVTGWRNNGAVVKNFTVTNCRFFNLNDDTNNAPVHFNMAATEPVNGFTFTNNVIDGATGGSKSGVYAQVTGETVFTNNVINNVSFRPYVIQLTTDDGIDDKFTVTGNTFSGSAAGRAQGLGNNAEGTDEVELIVSNNIFKDITAAQQICYWNFNEATTTAVLEKNYYDIDIVANPSKIYFNNAAADKYELSEMGVFPIYRALNEDGTINTASAYTPELPIAQIGEIGYETLAAAVEAAQAGETITLCTNVTESVTLPAGITFNGNGKQINGSITAAGNLNIAGHTKATSFNAGYNQPIITIGAGACLEMNGTGRMVIGHGATFNITGNITDAKNANVAELTPSLIMPGASFTGAGVTFNVTNAYISAPSSYCSSSSSASGTFDFNITNSIWESAGKLAFESQSTAATVNFELKDSKLTTGSHLVFGVSRGEVVIDNSNVNVGTSRQIENQSTMTVKNGSVVNGAVATSSNAKNPGTLIVDNATYAVTGEFSGSDLGTGTLIVNKTANFSAGSITKANIQIDATGMIVGDVVNITANLNNHTGTIEVINDNMLDAKIDDDGKIVIVERTLAGEGTETTPYVISNLDDLKFFRDHVNAGNTYAGKYIKLTDDIDLAPTRSESNWTPIGNSTNEFQGTFDGQNHTISNLVINGGSSSNQGFFGMTTDGEIKNVIFENAKVSGRLNVGVVAGTPYTSKYTNIKVTGHVEVNGMAYVGGVGGKNAYANWTDITVDVDDTSYVEANSTENGINYRTYVGGVIGFNGEGSHTFKNITSNIKVIGNIRDIGGIFGIAHYGNNFTNVTCTGNVEAAEGAEEVGGIAGVWNNTHGYTVTMTDCEYKDATITIDDVDVTATNAFVGGAYTPSNETSGTSGSLVINGETVYPYVAKIGEVGYNTLAKAVTAAQDEETIQLLWAQVDDPIAMNASLYGKDVTITGTATVDWSEGFLFVGRGGEGNATLTFDNAILTSASDQASTGIHVSGREKNTNDKYDGTVIIKNNSTIELDYLINKGTMTLDESTLTVKNGFSVGGRPAGETESGEDATATITLNNNSKVVVNNHNGMGLGYEAIGVMDINSGSTFETTQSFLITAKGTMNVNGGNVKTVGTLTNNGAVNVTGNASMNVNTLTGNNAINFTNVTIANANIGGAVNAFGTNNFTGETTIGGILSVGYNGSPAEQVVVNITGNFNGGNVLIGSSNDNVLNVGNAEDTETTAHFGQLGAFGDVNIVNADVTYGYTFIRNDFNVTNSTMEIKGGVNTYFAGNAKVVLDNTTWNLPGFANIGSYGGYMYGNADIILKNGSSMTATNLGIQVDGEKVVKLTLEDSSTLTATNLSNQGSIVLAGKEAKITSNELTGTNNVPTTNIEEYKVVYENGVYKVVEKVYVAQIGDVKFESLQEAVEAVAEDETIVLLGDITFTTGANGSTNGISYTRGVNFTLDLSGKTITSDLGGNALRFKIGDGNDITNTEVTINVKNGKVVSGSNNWCAISAATADNSDNKLTLNLTDLEVEANKAGDLAVKSWAGAIVNINNVDVTANYAGGFYACGGEITLENCTVNQEGLWTAPYLSVAVAVSNGGKMTVNSGTYSAAPKAVTDGNNQGTSHGSACAQIMSSGGTLIINGGTFSNDNFGDNSLATAARYLIYADAKGDLQINGGTFNALEGIIDNTTNTGADVATVTLKGGTYSANPKPRYNPDAAIPEGYDVKELPNGYYTVIQTKGTQTRELPDAGWYWFSTYITYNNEETALDNLQAALGSNASLIKGQNAFTQYLNYYGTNFWTSDLTTLSTAKMYMIKTKADNVTVNLTGSFEDYANTNIELKQGWNWIGYPINEVVSLNDAIPTEALKDGDIIKDQTSSARYYVDFELPNGNTFTGWDGSLTEMKPGQGYMFKSVNEKTFSYTTSSNGARSTLNTVDYSGDNHWFTDATQYPNNMNIVAMMSIDGEIVKGNYEVAAFANGECRGSARPIYIEALDAYVLYMTIHGEDVAELTFKYYDVNYGTEYELDNRLTYSSDAILGSLKDPYIFTMNILGIGENSIDNINIYPNPTTTDREINLQATCDKVEVFNALGVKVAEYHNVDTLDALETAGIYVIRITNDNAVKHCRLVVK